MVNLKIKIIMPENQTFLELVYQMRQNQKQYFKTRTKGSLIASKELEKKVDEQLDELCNKL